MISSFYILSSNKPPAFRGRFSLGENMYKSRFNYENTTRAVFFGEGNFDIPTIEPTKIKADKFIGFNEAMSSKKTDCGIHFFLDDYQFNRLWNNPDRYIEILKKYTCVMSPDFSLYSDFPKALQIYNHYRKHWLGAYWQLNGIEVIPTICWSDEESFEWCFDGEPQGGTVAVSSAGTQLNKQSKQLFINGYNEMIKRLQPETVIFYGNVPDECMGNIVRIRAFQDKWKEAKVNGW